MAGQEPLILIVDDDAAVRDALQFSLGLKGINVRTHGGGAGLLADPELSRAACVVIDDRMPSMDGFELLRQLEARKLQVPAILVASHATAELLARAAQAGAWLVLEKPFLDSALADTILKILNGTP